MIRYLPLLACGALLVLSGLVYGLWTDRWTVSSALQESSARLERVPWKLGAWEGQPVELDARQLAVSEAVANLSRRYVNRRTGTEISVMVLCGRGGPIAVHRPDVCYTGAGFQMAAAPEKWTTPGVDGSFWTTRFHKPGAAAETLRVFWAWSTAGDWTATDRPRLAYGRLPALYKLYLVRRLVHADEPLDQEPSRDLLQFLVPALHHCLNDDTAPASIDHLTAQRTR